MVEQGDGPEFAFELAAEEYVGGGRQIVGQREVLIDDLDPDRAGVDGPVEMDRTATEADFAMAGAEIAGDDLDQRRLAGAVVAHQANHFARLHMHIDVMQRADGAELLANAGEFEDRCCVSTCHQPPQT